MKNTIKVKTDYGLFLTWEEDKITKQLLKYSAHTRNELAMLLSFIHKEDTIIDIGAHIGTFTVPLAKCLNKNGRVYAFEADENNYQLLKANIKENHLIDKVLVKNAVISNYIDNFVNISPNKNNSGANYFVPTKDKLSSRIEVIKLDEWFLQNINNKVDIIKVDVEGAEVSVLRSAYNLLCNFKPLLYIEVAKEGIRRFGDTSKDLENILCDLGYEFFINIGPRNSSNDRYKLQKIKKFKDGGMLFDVLAIQPDSERYPIKYLGSFNLIMYKSKLFIKHYSKLVKKYLKLIISKQS